jgi:hypothetical protein
MKNTTPIINGLKSNVILWMNLSPGKNRSLAKKLDTANAVEEKRRKSDKRNDLFRSFLIFWFGFAIIPALTIDLFVDKQIQSQYHNLIFGCMLLFGLICSSVLTYYKWRSENDTN